LGTNYLLIDYENVQPDTFAAFDANDFRVMVFVGAGQSKVAFDTASALQKLGDKAEYVKISGNGSNALDFHIAYYIGKISAQDPGACFHVISKDSGFDPLIQHLTDQNIVAARFKDVLDIPILKTAFGRPTPEGLNVVIANLRRRGATKPTTLKALTNTIDSVFHKQLSGEAVEALVKTLEKDGLITVSDNKVSYAFPDS
jgi:hypothetical protein